MTPFVRDKNILTLSSFSKNQTLKMGDIVVVALQEQKRIIIHRIIATKGVNYLLKGDNNQLSDGWFSKKEIIGIVRRIETQSGIGYNPRQWQNIIIAIASKFKVINRAWLPGLGFLKSSLKTPIKNTIRNIG